MDTIAKRISEYRKKKNLKQDELAEKLSADVVTVIGTKFVLYRESEKNKKISLEL
jgi:RNA-binding protein YhbY